MIPRFDGFWGPKKKRWVSASYSLPLQIRLGGGTFLGSAQKFSMRSCTGIGNMISEPTVSHGSHLHIICFLFPLCCRTLGQSFQEQFNLLLNTAPKRRSWRFFVHLGEMKPGSLDGHRHQAGLELREYYAAACGHCQVRWGMLRGSWGENLPFIWHIWLYHTIHTACSV